MLLIYHNKSSSTSFNTTHISEKVQKADHVGDLEMKFRTLASGSHFVSQWKAI